MYQYDFPDTAEFQGSLLNPDDVITIPMETYSELVLLLFYPYRQLTDLTIDGSFTLRLREAVADGTIGEDEQAFLQNLQDAKSNSFRVSGIEDDLQQNTEHFQPVDQAFDDNTPDDEERQQDQDDVEGEELEELLRLLVLEADQSPFESSDESDTGNLDAGDSLPKTFSVKSIRQKGRLRCGYECLCDMSSAFQNLPHDAPVLDIEAPSAVVNEPEELSAESDPQQPQMPQPPGQRNIVQILLNRTMRHQRTFEEITGNDAPVDTLEANGSVRSIIDWAKKANLDRGQ